MQGMDIFLRSRYHFKPEERLLQFRFHILNAILLITVLLSFLTLAASMTGMHSLGSTYEKTLGSYTLVTLFALYLIRSRRSHYRLALNILVVGALINFTLALLLVVHDPFRLVWFHVITLSGFLLGGKRYGITLGIASLVIVALCYALYPLEISTYILYTFFSSFVVLIGLAYFFVEKTEKDAAEFLRLNQKLARQIEAESRQRKEQEQILLRQCRLASIGEMLDSIAHQWRQPLMHINAVLMNIDRVIEAKKTKEPYLTEKMDEIVTLTSHMSQTIEDFRSLFKTEKQQREFTIQDVLGLTLQILDPSLKGIQVEVIKSETPLYGYSNEMMQVLLILIGNAIEAFEGKKINSKKITIESTQEAQYVTLSISDNAGGIDAHDLDHIFDSYYTTKGQNGGSGLGLYIAKIIIEQNMHGSIHAHNTTAGACFTIQLRRAL